MRTVDIHEATTLLSSLVDVIERGVEREVIIARNGRPAARLVAIETVPQGRRLGVAKGRFEVPAGIDRSNDKVGRRFGEPDRCESRSTRTSRSGRCPMTRSTAC